MTAPDRIVLPELGEADRLVADLIARAQRLILMHPAAAQAAYRALVAEGRRFAQTEQGRAWRGRLEASEALRRAMPLWEAATFNMLDAGDVGVLPGQWIELVAQAVSRLDLEAVTAMLTEPSTSSWEAPLGGAGPGVANPRAARPGDP